MSRARSSGYAVGYGKPPEASRFKKGVSGNPRGRPAKAAASKPPTNLTELDDLVMQEALRPITIRENDQPVTLPMIQAVVRSLGVAAVKGHHKSQVALAEMVKAIQGAELEQRLQLWKSAVEYKDNWTTAIADAKRAGQPPPDPLPHPDDIGLDINNMKVRFNGPMCIDEKAHWDQNFERLKSWQDEAKELRAKLKRPGKYADIYRSELAHAERLIELFSAMYPDEETRRAPGFDISSWRRDQQVVKDVIAKHSRRQKRAMKSV